MPEVGTPSTSGQTHTSTQEWQSFEIRMRRRRAERCLLRAEIALDAGFEEDARVALDEARRLDWQSPDFDSLKARLDQRRAEEAAQRNARRYRVYAMAAALALTTTAGALLLRGDDIAGTPAPLAATSNPVEAAAPAPRPTIEPPPVAEAAPSVVAEEQLVSTEATAPPIAPPADRTDPSRSRADGADSSRKPEQQDPAVRPAAGETKTNLTLLEALNRNSRLSSEQPRIPDVAVPTSSLPTSQAVPNSVASLGQTAVGSPVSMPDSARVAELPPAPVAPPPAARTTPAPATPPAPPSDAPVRAVLSQYESAYTNLNASAARAVWPGAPRTLERAFDSLETQRVSLGRCDVSMKGPRAQATCSGSYTWEPKVGGGTRSGARTWRFELENAGGVWKITTAEAR